MLTDALTALASAASTTVVAAIATDAWQTTRDKVAKLLGRGDEGSQRAVETQLSRHAELVERSDEPERARERLIATWQLEFEAMLLAAPSIEGQLRALVASVQKTLPSERNVWAGQINQHVHVNGFANSVNVVAAGDVVQHPPGSATRLTRPLDEYRETDPS